jgi:N-acylneuraminate cytidylyltransferase
LSSSNKHRRLAVIPARGGSRRVPRKNARNFGGRPILAYSIEAALRSGLFDRVVVSTDCAEIAETARQCGAETPFQRHSDLSDDYTPVSSVTCDALDRLDPQGLIYGEVAQLMANCPLRTDEDVRQSYEQFQNISCRSQISVVRFGWQNPWWATELAEDYEMKPVFAERLRARSQDLPRLFCPTGAVWWAKAETLREHRTYHVPGRTGWEIRWDHGIDIDTDEDWAWAELLLSRAGAGRVA